MGVRGNDTEVDRISRLDVGGIVADILVVKVEGAEKTSWARASARDARERTRKSLVHVLHVVSRSFSACLMLMFSIIA